MDFNFRGWDAQMQHHNMYPPTPVKDGLWRGTSLGGSHEGMGIYPGPVETRKAIQRELEKERIREEILVEEIARKRDLEAEVRREIAMEMAMHGGGGFPPSFTPRPPPASIHNRLQPMMPPFAPVVSFEEKFGRHCEIGRFPVAPLPHQRLPVDGKKKVIDLGKPNGVTVSGAKGKPASEWSCAVCKVSAPCEQAFKQHLVGKKHQAQMAALKAKNTQKHATKSGEIGLGVESTTTMETEPSKCNKSVKTQPPPLMKKNSSKCDSKKEEDKKNSSKCDSKKEEDKKSDSSKCGSKKEEDKKSELWFSCEMCKVGASSHEVMNAHIKGKKHLNNLLKLHQESGAADKKSDSSKCDSKKEEEKKSELWFSCEMCKVGASSHEVMNAHIKGKKHLSNLLKLRQESVAAAGPGTKKPHKAETEVGIKDKKSTGKTQVADSESTGSVVFNATYSSYI